MLKIKKKMVVLLISLMLSFISISGCIEETNTIKISDIIYVDDDGGADYTKIQDAIDHVLDGGTIFVSNGTYYETLRIDKSISLIGADENYTIINHKTGATAFSDEVVNISADNCSFKGFNIMCVNFISDILGIKISSSNNTVSNNIISYAKKGIHLNSLSKNNTVSLNIISGASYGIYIHGSDNNKISKNSISSCTTYGIYVVGSDNSIISGNLILDNALGIRIQGSKNSNIFENTIKNCSQGVRFCCGSANNTAYYNVFVNNRDWNALDEISNQSNHWDNGIVGNYWDDYTVKYPYANQLNGIWDTPYSIAIKESFDRFPLVNPVSI